MTGLRVSGYGKIDTSRTLRFRFDGNSYFGHPGDTVASALLACGVRVVNRSFKYHRPRGILGSWVEEPNAIVDLIVNARRTPNCRATTTSLQDGMELFSLNGYPNAASDRLALIDKFARFIPASFYYKTFIWPNWHIYEPRIRAMTGLGTASLDWQASLIAVQQNIDCDVLVVGGGAAGLAAAKSSAQAGKSVILVDDRDAFGGWLNEGNHTVENISSEAWIRKQIEALQVAGARMLLRTTAFGFYDHNLVTLNQVHDDGRQDTLHRVRARLVILATGAIERPLTFSGNDSPGVMCAQAAASYLHRYGVLVGKNIAVASNNSLTDEVSAAMRRAGAEVSCIDVSELDNVTYQHNDLKLQLRNGIRRSVDTVLMSGGFTPTVHLHCQAGGKLDWRADILAFVPRSDLEDVWTIGAAAGEFNLARALESAFESASGRRTKLGDRSWHLQSAWPIPNSKGRQWIDFQNDVTLKDIELAARENMVSVEHLKRYTTLGMANDQGKTSNMPGLAAMAAITGKTIPETGTTTYRPPFVPIPLGSFAGTQGGELFAPIKRLSLENEHKASEAVFREYGGWLRPAWYGRGEAQQHVQREARIARTSAGLMDSSPLGKIEIFGPDAAKFVDFVYYNTMSTLKPGAIRYGFLLSETGVLLDDGVLSRISENHFVVSCSSSHVESVTLALDIWRQDQFDADRVFILNSTAQWATLNVTGPRSKDIINSASLGFTVDDDALPHMNFVSFEGVRISRVSFTGDRSYEINVSSNEVGDYWKKLTNAGREYGACLLGLEALLILRAEKGLIVVGKDTDGETMPHDIGFPIPRQKKQKEYVGKRSLFTDEATRVDRRTLVGLAVNGRPLATGSHVVQGRNSGYQSIGFVTSSYVSPNTGGPIAMAMLREGLRRIGDTVNVFHLGEIRTAVVCNACVLDKDWERLNA